MGNKRYVTNIISEKRDKMWKLYNISEKKLEKEKEDKDWYEFLLENGVKQEYEYCDGNTVRLDSVVFNTDRGQQPYYIGYEL